MSSLSDVLKNRARVKPQVAASAPQSHTPAPPASPESPASPGNAKLNALLARKPAAPTPTPAPTAAEALTEITATQVTLTNDMTSWPDQQLAGNTASPVSAELRARLEHIATVLVSEDVSDALVETLTFIHDNPALKDILLPEDIGLLVRALQSSHGIILSEKAARSTKKSKNAAKASAVAADLADVFSGVSLL